MAQGNYASMAQWNNPIANTDVTTEGLLQQFNQNNGLTDFSNQNFMGGGANNPAAASTGPSWWDQAMGYKGADGSQTTGVVTGGLGALQGLANTWLGFQNLGIAKDQMAFQQDSFNKNYNNQVTLTNADLQDRQKARVAANPNATSVTDYMNQNRVGG